MIKTTSFKLDSELLKRIKIKATEKEITQSELVTTYLLNGLKQDETVSNVDMKVCSMSLDIICSISQWFCHLGIHYSIHVENNMILLKVSKKSWIDFVDIIYYPGCLGLQRKVLEANKIRSTLLVTEDVNGG